MKIFMPISMEFLSEEVVIVCSSHVTTGESESVVKSFFTEKALGLVFIC